MIESMTICENVCCDFSWVGKWAPAIIAATTALLIAFVAYPWQKQKDRDQKVDEERRHAVANLILKIEALMAKVKGSALVGIKEVPSMAKEKVEAQKALSVVRAYGCAPLVECTIKYDRAIQKYRKALEKEKESRAKREEEIPSGTRFSRGPEYTSAQNATSEMREEMMKVRDAFFDKLSITLKIKVPRLELDEEKVEEEDAK